jgi:acyl-CoA reductase-like NAD-dependent aldehyde dehydrogenase
MSEIRVDALEAAVREFNLSLPAWAPFKRWGDLTLQERDQCLTRAVEILRAIAA